MLILNFWDFNYHVALQQRTLASTLKIYLIRRQHILDDVLRLGNVLCADTVHWGVNVLL
jgi:hypothetical protein